MGKERTSSESSTELLFSPEGLQAQVPELFARLGQLDPVQIRQLGRAAALSINQPGALNAPRPAGISPTVIPAVRQSFPNIQPAVFGPLIEALRGSAQRGQADRLQQANQIISGVPSFVDPRDTNVLAPTRVTETDTETKPDTLRTVATVLGLLL